jgi:hypothetical protein
VALRGEILAIETGFWTGGEDHFLAHVDAHCMLVFAQMRGVHSRAEVAATARDPNRWSDLRLADVMLHQPREELLFLSYEARAKRATGEPYRALIGSAYLRRDDGWKLTFHQHGELAGEEPGQAGTP